jgi:zinc/manganese transport system permease protein
MIQVLGLPLLMCLALAGVLGYLGIHVLKREIIFIDIALAQLAAVGAIGAHLAFHAHGDSILGFTVAFAFVLAAAGFYAFARRKVAQIPVEAVIGVTYAVAAAGALFLVGVAPGGHVHVQHMLAGSILWVTWRDVLVCASSFAAVGGLFRLLRGPLTRISDDYDTATSEGLNVVLWDFVFYALCGLVIALAVRVSGIVLVFAFLIIPATISAIFSSGWRTRLLAAWAAGFTASVLGLLFAYRLNFSMGPSVAVFLGLELALAGVYALRRSRGLALTSAGCLTAVFLGLLFAGPIADTEHVDRAGGDTHDSDAHAHVSHAHTEEHEANFEQLLEGATGDINKLVRLFAVAPGDEAKSDLVARALDAELRTGARFALEFLSGDPPLFFRQVVVDKLEEVTGRPSGFDVAEPFAAAVNRRAAAKVALECGVEVP